MLWARGQNEFLWSLSSIEGTRPSLTSMGTAVTPGSGVKGSYSAQILTGAQIAHDCFGILVSFNSGTSTGAARNIVADIGIDAAGGTSYTVKIPDLIASNAATYLSHNGGIHYYFPLRVKAGSSIACRANSSAVTGFNCWVEVFGRPVDRRAVWAGDEVIAYGITGNTGTTVTAGTVSDGAWTSLGTTTRDHFWWQHGFMSTDTAIAAAQTYHCDVAIGTSTSALRVAIKDGYWVMNTSEASGGPGAAGLRPCVTTTKAGEIVYGRAQAATTPDTGLSMAAYGVVA
jgi:hypothetical protein